MRWVEHIAGEYLDGVQRCRRCSGVIIDDRGACYIREEGPPPRGFEEGTMYVGGVSPMSMVKRRPDRPEDEILECSPIAVIEQLEPVTETIQ